MRASTTKHQKFNKSSCNLDNHLTLDGGTACRRASVVHVTLDDRRQTPLAERVRTLELEEIAHRHLVEADGTLDRQLGENALLRLSIARPRARQRVQRGRRGRCRLLGGRARRLRPHKKPRYELSNVVNHAQLQREAETVIIRANQATESEHTPHAPGFARAVLALRVELARAPAPVVAAQLGRQGVAARVPLAHRTTEREDSVLKSRR